MEKRKSGRGRKKLDSAIRIKTLLDNATKFNPFNILILFVDLIISDAFHQNGEVLRTKMPDRRHYFLATGSCPKMSKNWNKAYLNPSNLSLSLLSRPNLPYQGPCHT